MRAADRTVQSARLGLQEYSKQARPFTLVAVAQGRSVTDYLRCYNRLRKMGYRHIAIGGLLNVDSTPPTMFTSVGTACFMTCSTESAPLTPRIGCSLSGATIPLGICAFSSSGCMEVTTRVGYSITSHGLRHHRQLLAGHGMRRSGDFWWTRSSRGRFSSTGPKARDLSGQVFWKDACYRGMRLPKGLERTTRLRAYRCQERVHWTFFLGEPRVHGAVRRRLGGSVGTPWTSPAGVSYQRGLRCHVQPTKFSRKHDSDSGAAASSGVPSVCQGCGAGWTGVWCGSRRGLHRTASRSSDPWKIYRGLGKWRAP